MISLLLELGPDILHQSANRQEQRSLACRQVLSDHFHHLPLMMGRIPALYLRQRSSSRSPALELRGEGTPVTPIPKGERTLSNHW